ncbi:hypothetical protein KCV87_21020 [Actinosynnema pretiosum subsp. pretiosum]|uniref:Uncharacterized protein n=2 Tax=Actinosynnema TaxID=40566 RepID=C6WSB4_ACTMD|nr:hypothetical protein [Actinosynnema mirum]ACU40784.1 hypothetical protein Amir_6991 [Actinosynnema mirum DSM 43827]AXX34291.1 hypothetical protein APASM_6926 [Actinosynnema pretiosum subsp. pretiosum]QUF02001.1 hypothetical protein KCV87_21020 [Actinosynnema pretiosum subsp. pretiosum]
MNAEPLSQNESYVGQRLLFQRAHEVEVTLTDAIGGWGARSLLLKAFGGAFLIFVLGSVATAVVGGAGALIGDSGITLVLLGLLTFLLPWAWMAGVLLLPQHRVLSDWHLLLDGQAPVAETAYGVVYRALTVDRGIPAAITPRRVAVGDPAPGVRNVLRVSLGRYSVYVSVFAFGNDLYLGWTMWLRFLPITALARWFGSVLRGDRGLAGAIEMEPVKALREAVHNALREAVEAAAVGRTVPIVETFGYEVPLEQDGQWRMSVGDRREAVAEAGTGAPQGLGARLSVSRQVEVFSEHGEVLGTAEPGTSYELLREDGAGLLVRDSSGVVAVIRDRDAVLR